MKPDKKGKRKSGKKRPITDGVVSMNGDASGAGSSGSLPNGMINKDF